MNKKHKLVSYAKWGYIFIAPFFIVYIVCSLIPLLSTFVYSFFEYYRSGLGNKMVGPEFVGFKNYIDLFSINSNFNNGELKIATYTGQTMLMWIMGAVPQLLFSLILAVIFTSARLKIKGQRFFKTVIYMPNLIMAAAFGMLFFMLFEPSGSINKIIINLTGNTAGIRFFDMVIPTRVLVALLNFIMWFGNTTILLMAGIMGIDQSLFEAASIDGATSWQVFTKITLPLLLPIMVYVAITSLIGGLQMYDVPQILTNGGAPGTSSMTLVMWLSSFLGTNPNYGIAGALSVLVFIITGALSLVVFKTMNSGDDKPKKKAKKGV